MCKDRSKSSKLHSERIAIGEHFCCGSKTLLLLIKLGKLIQIFVLISVQVRPIQSERYATNPKSGCRLELFE